MNRIHLKRGTPLEIEMIMSGQHPDYPGRWVAQSLEGMDVLFSKVEATPVNKLYVWLKAVRAISLTATLMPAIAVLLWLQVLALDINWFVSICAVFGVLCLQVSVNLFNDVGDYIKLIDLPSTLGGSGVIQQGWVNTLTVKKAAIVFLVLGCVLGFPALLHAPVAILMCGILAVMGVVGYSGKPFNLKYKGLGDLAVFVLCGPVLTMGFSYAATGMVQDGVVLIGCYFGFAAAAILNANNMNDIEVDTSRGASTLASVMGFVVARNWQALYYIFAYLCLFNIESESYILKLLPMITLPLAVLQIKKLKATNNSSDISLVNVRFDAAKLHLLMGVTICAALAWLVFD